MHGVRAFSSGVRVSGPLGLGGLFFSLVGAAKPSAGEGADGLSDPGCCDGDGFFPRFLLEARAFATAPPAFGA